MTMRMSAAGRARLSQREGVRTKAYRDSEGVWTIGVGHTASAGEPVPAPGMVITREQVDEILTRDLKDSEALVNEAVSVPLSQGQFDALVSFAFNVGDKKRRFRNSTLVRKLNSGDYRGAADEFLHWVKPPELRGRRESERRQFLAATDAPLAERAAEPDAPPVTVKELRKIGSRTINGADQAKGGLGGLVAAAAGAEAVSSQITDVAEQAQSAVESLSSAAGALAWAQGHWKLLALVALLCLAAYFAWSIWRGASLVTRARVDDANTGVHVGR